MFQYYHHYIGWITRNAFLIRYWQVAYKRLGDIQIKKD